MRRAAAERRGGAAVAERLLGAAHDEPVVLKAHERTDLVGQALGVLRGAAGGIHGVAGAQVGGDDEGDLDGGTEQVVDELEEVVRVSREVVVDDDAGARGRECGLGPGRGAEAPGLRGARHWTSIELNGHSTLNDDLLSVTPHESRPKPVRPPGEHLVFCTGRGRTRSRMIAPPSACRTRLRGRDGFEAATLRPAGRALHRPRWTRAPQARPSPAGGRTPGPRRGRRRPRARPRPPPRSRPARS